MKVPPARNDGREPALSEVNVILEHVAQVTGVELVDVYSAIDNSHPVPYSENKLYKDPIHLSAISHTIIADLLYNQFINGPVCGDDNCDFGEDQCNCPEDCGTPPSTKLFVMMVSTKTATHTPTVMTAIVMAILHVRPAAIPSVTLERISATVPKIAEYLLQRKVIVPTAMMTTVTEILTVLMLTV
jgi:hypothetical protein